MVGTNLLGNRVAVDKLVTLRSVNGPQFTVIQGYQVPGVTNGDGAIRCVYLANGASLSSFTLANGSRTETSISSQGRLALTPGTMLTCLAPPTWTDARASSVGRWTSALMNFKGRSTLGCSDTACQPTARRTL